MPETNLTPQQHNERRREQKRKQRAIRKAKAAHSKAQGEVETRVIINGSFDLDDLCWKARDRNYDYITFHFLLRLMRERQLAIQIEDVCGIPEVEGKTIYPTVDGWQWKDGSPVETSITINRVLVPLAHPVAVAFTWRYNRKEGKHWMEVL